MRLALATALLSLAACSSARGVLITRGEATATVAIDADRLSSDAQARAATVQALAAEACGARPARVTDEVLSSREEVQLDLDRVWATMHRRLPTEPSLARNLPGPAPTHPGGRQPDERATRVLVPVLVVSIACGG